jgi:hypothetical protein
VGWLRAVTIRVKICSNGSLSPLDLEFLLAISTRAASILAGGADFRARAARQAEADACRGAMLAGTLFQRLNNVDTAGRNGQVRVFEDTTVGVASTVVAESAVVAFSGVVDGLLPWQPAGATATVEGATLLVMPRANPSRLDVQHLVEWRRAVCYRRCWWFPPTGVRLSTARCRCFVPTATARRVGREEDVAALGRQAVAVRRWASKGP